MVYWWYEPNEYFSPSIICPIYICKRRRLGNLHCSVEQEIQGGMKSVEAEEADRWEGRKHSNSRKGQSVSSPKYDKARNRRRVAKFLNTYILHVKCMCYEEGKCSCHGTYICHVPPSFSAWYVLCSPHWRTKGLTARALRLPVPAISVGYFKRITALPDHTRLEHFLIHHKFGYGTQKNNSVSLRRTFSFLVSRTIVSVDDSCDNTCFEANKTVSHP